MADGNVLQDWLMVNLDKRQYQWTDRFVDGLGIFWDFEKYGPGYPYYNNPDFDVIDLLTRSYLEWPRETAFGDEVDANLEKIRQPNEAHFARMSIDVHAHVFDCLEYVDALCLAHTCRYFWVIGLRRLIQIGNSYVASWAGDRLICIGNRVKSLPPTVELPPDILSTLKPDQGPSFYQFQVVKKAFKEIYLVSPLDYFELRKSSDTAARQLDACISAADAFGPNSTIGSELREWSRHLRSFSFSQRDTNLVWALRNLDTGEYLTLKGIAMHGYDGDWASSEGDQIDLLSVLLYRTAWSTTGGTGSNQRGLHQGPWVGHRFDVSTVDQILADGRMVWKDITAEVKEELYNIAVSDGKPWAEAYKRGDPIDL